MGLEAVLNLLSDLHIVVPKETLGFLALLLNNSELYAVFADQDGETMHCGHKHCRSFTARRGSYCMHESRCMNKKVS
jgi:hypothetical protein